MLARIQVGLKPDIAIAGRLQALEQSIRQAGTLRLRQAHRLRPAARARYGYVPNSAKALHAWSWTSSVRPIAWLPP